MLGFYLGVISRREGILLLCLPIIIHPRRSCLTPSNILESLRGLLAVQIFVFGSEG